MTTPLLLQALHTRETAQPPSAAALHVRRTFSSDPCMLNRLKLERVLDGHAGCVNTVHFNPSGELLLSGSDDLRVIIWDYQTGQQRFSFEPGHRNNIFQARVVPHTGDKTIISCAADGQVRVSHLGEGGAVAKRKLAQHSGRAHKLALVPDQPHTFFSCGEDGDVRLFDLRESEARSSAGIKMNVRGGSKSDRGPRLSLDLNAIHVNPCRPWMFAVGGDDQYARVYDVRELRSGVDAAWRQYTETRHAAAGRPTFKVSCEPVARLCPEDLANSHYNGRHITCVMYSHTGELLVTYHQEDMYLLAPWDQQQPPAQGRRRRDDDEEEDAWGGDQRGGSDRPGGGAGASTSAAGSSGSGGGGGRGDNTGRALMRYRGHRNVQTVKGCSFLGLSDEYVVTGSDCGHIFIYGKEDGRLRQMMKGDPHVVNCLEPHPWQPLVLATSGIANDVKIWAPVNAEVRPPDPTYVDEVTGRNTLYLRNRDRAARTITPSPGVMLQLELQDLLSRRTGGARRRREDGEAGEDGRQQRPRGDGGAPRVPPNTTLGFLLRLFGRSEDEDDEDSMVEEAERDDDEEGEEHGGGVHVPEQHGLVNVEGSEEEEGGEEEEEEEESSDEEGQEEEGEGESEEPSWAA